MDMYGTYFEDFLTSGDSLRVYSGDKLVFSSQEKMLQPLLLYIKEHASKYQDVIVMDKIVGRAAALLLVKARCYEVFSPLASERALEILDRHKILHYFSRVVPVILKPGTQEICPMEKLASGVSDPEKFYKKVAHPG
jgi:hypothetical protein